jgi:hypothetical protein
MLLVLGALIFLLGRCFCATQPDYRTVAAAEDSQHDDQPSAPLLEDGV